MPTDLSANDILLFGALVGALLVVLIGGLWALAHRGRKRWSTERADRVVAEGIQIIKAGPGDAVVVTYAGMLTKERRGQIVEAIERRLPKGVNTMLLDGGLRMSHVVSFKDAPQTPSQGHLPPKPIPHSFGAMTAGWLAFSDETRQAYGSFERYAQHLKDDPTRSLGNPVPQPTRQQ